MKQLAQVARSVARRFNSVVWIALIAIGGLAYSQIGRLPTPSSWLGVARLVIGSIAIVALLMWLAQRFGGGRRY
ncbi:MAG: hypothetical protein ACYDA3_13805 [Gaiellaceae bacterium]